MLQSIKRGWHSATYGWISQRSGRRRWLYSLTPRYPALAYSGTQLTPSSISPPYTVWGARGHSASRQRPHKRGDLKRPNKPPTAASSGRSWYKYQEKDTSPHLVGSGRTAKAYLSISEMLSSANCTILAAGNVSKSAGHFISSVAVEGKRHFRFSPLRVAAGCRLCTREKESQRFPPASVFPALVFRASLGHTSTHKDSSVSSPLLWPGLFTFHTTTYVGLPPYLEGPAGIVPLDSSYDPVRLHTPICSQPPNPPTHSHRVFSAPARLLSCNRKSLLFCS